jgi:hypothetical protein
MASGLAKSGGSQPGKAEKDPAVSAISHLRVARTYKPDRNGAKRLARRYGPQLVCVRHRLNAAGTVRYTTVELLVERVPIAARARSRIAIRIPAADKATRRQMLAGGAQWDPQHGYWLLPRNVARSLQLLRYVVPIGE